MARFRENTVLKLKNKINALITYCLEKTDNVYLPNSVVEFLTTKHPSFPSCIKISSADCREASPKYQLEIKVLMYIKSNI